MEMPPGLPIPPQDWAQTPLSVQAVVVMLWQENQMLKAQVKELQQQVAVLQTEVEQLRERVNQTSRNSSKPPSSDPPGTKQYPARKPSGRKRGGQKGHKGKGRKLKPLNAVDRIVVSKPTVCTGCGVLLLGEDPQPQRHQVSELPRIEPEVVEYQLHTLSCLACGQRNRGEWPDGMPSGSFGPRLQATIGYLSGRMGVSRRDIEELLAAMCHVDISLGSIPAQEQRVSQALAQPVAEAAAYIQKQAAVNLDETSWQQMNDKHWLWVGTTPLVTLFLILKTRSKKGVKALLGEAFGGVVGSDRFSAYNSLPPTQRQLCWSHLIRDFQALVDRGGESALIGQLLLAQVETFFDLWYRVRDGTLARAEFQNAMAPIRHEVGCLLRIAASSKQSKTANTCGNILKVETAMWTFVDQASVEPTNNAAERAVRRGVIWRRRSFGSQSETGSRFVASILTAVTTLRQQRRDVLDYLTQACQAANLGVAAPSLLPPVLNDS
jgi:transposase